MKTRDSSMVALRDLITVCEDAAAGLRSAAHGVHDIDFRTALCYQAHLRVGFAEELRMLVEQRGDTSPPSGSIVGSAHRGWMDLRAALEAHNPAILVECLRGEEAAAERFEGALAYLDEPASLIVERQLGTIRAFHHSLAGLEAQAFDAHRREVLREELVDAHSRDLHEEHRPG